MRDRYMIAARRVQAILIAYAARQGGVIREDDSTVRDLVAIRQDLIRLSETHRRVRHGSNLAE